GGSSSSALATGRERSFPMCLPGNEQRETKSFVVTLSIARCYNVSFLYPSDTPYPRASHCACFYACHSMACAYGIAPFRFYPCSFPRVCPGIRVVGPKRPGNTRTYDCPNRLEHARLASGCPQRR